MAGSEFTTEELESEEWRDIPRYEGCYQASSLGRVRSIRTVTRTYCGLILKDCNKQGYRQVALNKDGNQRVIKVHRLVMAAFQGDSSLTVNHIDCDKANNRLGNLEYATHQENIAHAVRNHRQPRGDKSPSRMHRERRPRGEQSKQAKLTERQVREIRQLLKNRMSGPKIASIYGVSAMLITQIKYRRVWSHVE